MVEFFAGDGGYGSFLHGVVVDMFYLPLWQGSFPDWLPIWGGQPFEFFRPVFNVADAAISVGVALMILVQRKQGPATAVPDPEPSSADREVDGTTRSAESRQEGTVPSAQRDAAPPDAAPH